MSDHTRWAWCETAEGDEPLAAAIAAGREVLWVWTSDVEPPGEGGPACRMPLDAFRAFYGEPETYAAQYVEYPF